MLACTARKDEALPTTAWPRRILVDEERRKVNWLASTGGRRPLPGTRARMSLNPRLAPTEERKKGNGLPVSADLTFAASL